MPILRDCFNCLGIHQLRITIKKKIFQLPLACFLLFSATCLTSELCIICEGEALQLKCFHIKGFWLRFRKYSFVERCKKTILYFEIILCNWLNFYILCSLTDGIRKLFINKSSSCYPSCATLFITV